MQCLFAIKRDLLSFFLDSADACRNDELGFEGAAGKVVTPMPSERPSLTPAGSLLGSVAGVRGLQMVAANISVCSIREGRKLSTLVLFEPAHR
jgi:hypothetical protein